MHDWSTGKKTKTQKETGREEGRQNRTEMKAPTSEWRHLHTWPTSEETSLFLPLGSKTEPSHSWVREPGEWFPGINCDLRSLCHKRVETRCEVLQQSVLPGTVFRGLSRSRESVRVFEGGGGDFCHNLKTFFFLLFERNDSFKSGLYQLTEKSTAVWPPGVFRSWGVKWGRKVAWSLAQSCWNIPLALAPSPAATPA